MPIAVHLKSQSETFFRQNGYGGPWHVSEVNYLDNADVLGDINSGTLRIQTLCGRNLKYGNYAQIKVKSGYVPNVCDDCAYQIEVEDDRAAGQQRSAGTGAAEQARHDDLPF